ncbi:MULTISPECIES: competence type IV pilus major pilin ComGC [Bacillus]|uniref:competence type IV pilus major pilin ComGC n=1 Tax=Bacillus TaxID=1386 RepID=UPI000BB70435|nr:MULTISPECIES: competence type IV pilus major pilin ComGC [Bacillus]
MLLQEKGFTLVEMLIVMLVITILLLVMLPNATKNTSVIGTKGCDAFIKMVESQVQTYRLDKRENPTSLQDLNHEDYLKEHFNKNNNTLRCPGGEELTLDGDKVIPINTPPSNND